MQLKMYETSRVFLGVSWPQHFGRKTVYSQDDFLLTTDETNKLSDGIKIISIGVLVSSLLAAMKRKFGNSEGE